MHEWNADNSGQSGPKGLWWAVPNEIAGMAMPRIHPGRWDNSRSPLRAFEDDLPLLADAGVGAVVSLVHGNGLPAIFSSAGFAHYALPIPDGSAPSYGQFAGFLNFAVQQRSLGHAVAVHCAAGRGRTGTMLAGYLISTGYSFGRAVRMIREAQPGAIETQEQMRFLEALPRYLPQGQSRR